MNLPGMAWASVKRVESLATKQEVNKRAASLLCNLAKSSSSFSCGIEFPAMFRVPPAPAPYISKAFLEEKYEER